MKMKNGKNENQNCFSERAINENIGDTATILQ